jgi:hypothetical protein
MGTADQECRVASYRLCGDTGECEGRSREKRTDPPGREGSKSHVASHCKRGRRRVIDIIIRAYTLLCRLKTPAKMPGLLVSGDNTAAHCYCGVGFARYKDKTSVRRFHAGVLHRRNNKRSGLAVPVAPCPWVSGGQEKRTAGAPARPAVSIWYDLHRVNNGCECRDELA